MCASMVGVGASANSSGDPAAGAAAPGHAGAEAAADEARLAEIATELADGVDAALGPWVERCVTRRCTEWQGSCPPEVAAAARAAGVEAAGAVGPEVRALLATDPDDQRANPLQLIRRATAWPTTVLREAGVPAVVRDDEAQRQFPDDDYDLTPANFADLDPALAEAGIAWGAAKAHVVLARRRREGRR
jgi:hypothetical protein